LTDEEYTVFGRKQPPAKIYHTCTFEGLGSKKTEFLNRFVEALEGKGLKKIPPIEPFELAVGGKDVFSLSIWNEIGRREMVGTDVLLGSDERGTHTRAGLRAESQGDNLRFGYLYGTWHDPRSPAATKFFLELIVGMVLLIVWMVFCGLFLLGKPFGQAHGITVFIFVMVVLFLLPFLPVLFVFHRRETRPRKEMDQLVLEIANSMGGKQITPFKKTTVRLED